MPLLNKSTSFPVKKFFLADTRGGPSPSRGAEAQVSRGQDSSQNRQNQKRQVFLASSGESVRRIETQQRFVKWQEELRQKNQEELDRALQGKLGFKRFGTKLWHSIKSGIKDPLASLKQAWEINREVTKQLRNGTNLPEEIAAYQKARLEAIRQQAETKNKGVLTEEALFDIVTEENVQIIIQNCLRIAFETVATEISGNPENNNLNPDTISQMIVNKMMENIGLLTKNTSKTVKRVLKSIQKEGLVSNLQEVIAEFLKEKLGTNPTNADLGKILQEQLDSEKQSHEQGTSGLDEFLQSLEINFATEKRGVKGGHLDTTNPWLDLVAGSNAKTIATTAIFGGTSALLRNFAKWFGWLDPFTAGGIGALFGGIRGVQSAMEQQSTVFRKLAWRGKIDDPQSQGIASYEMISANNLLAKIKNLKGSLENLKDSNNTPNNNTNLFQEFEEINTTVRTILKMWEKGKYALKNDLNQQQLSELSILAPSQGSDNSAKSSEGVVYETLISVIQTEWFKLQIQLAKIEEDRLKKLHDAGIKRVKNEIKELEDKIWEARMKNSGNILFGGAKGAGLGFAGGVLGYMAGDFLSKKIAIAGDFLSKKMAGVWSFLQKTSTFPPTQGELTNAIVDSFPSTEGGVTQLPGQGTDIQTSGSGGPVPLVTEGGGKSGASISDHLRSLNSNDLNQSVVSPDQSGIITNNTVKEPTPPTFEEILANSGFLQIPDGEWRSERLQIAGTLGRVYAELMENNPEANLVKILSKPDGQLDPRRIVPLAEALTNANNSEGRLEILEKATRNPDEFFAGMEQWANKIGEAQQKAIILEFLIKANENGVNIPIPPELTKLYEASVAASILNTPENSAIIANAIKTALAEADIGDQDFKIDKGLEWYPARDGATRGLAKVLHENPKVGVLLSNDDGQIDPQKLAAMAEMLTRAYRQGQQDEQVEKAIGQVLNAMQQNPKEYIKREIRFSVTGEGPFGPISPEAQQRMLDVFNEALKNYPQEPEPAAEPTNLGLRESDWPTPDVLREGYNYKPKNLGLREPDWPTSEVLRERYDYDLPPGTGSEPGIVYRETITNDLQTLFDSSGKIPKGKYISFDPTNLPDISQTEATTVLHLDLSKTSMAEAIDGLNKIAGQTDKPIVLAVGPNGPNAGIEFVTGLGRQIGQYENLREAMKQGRIVLAFAYEQLDTDTNTVKIAIANPSYHINFDTAINLGERPERGWLNTNMPDDEYAVETNKGMLLELLGHIITGDNSPSEIQILSIEKGVGPRIRPVSEIFADSINKKLTELAQNAGVNLGSDEVNIFTNGVQIDRNAVTRFLNQLFSNPENQGKLKQLSDEDLTFLATLIAGSENNRNLNEILNGILKKDPNSPIAAIIREFKNREGPTWLAKLVGCTAILLAVLGVVGVAAAIIRSRSRRQAGGAGSAIYSKLRAVGEALKQRLKHPNNQKPGQSRKPNKPEKETEGVGPDIEALKQDLGQVSKIKENVKNILTQLSTLLSEIDQLGQSQNSDIFKYLTASQQGLLVMNYALEIITELENSTRLSETSKNALSTTKNALTNALLLLQKIMEKLATSDNIIESVEAARNETEEINQTLQDTLPKLQEALEALAKVQTDLELQIKRAETPTLMIEFARDWGNNRLDDATKNWGTVKSILPESPQESNDLPTLQELRRITGRMGAAIIIIATQNPNLDPSNPETLKFLQQRFKQELDELFDFADKIAKALEDEKGWNKDQHVSNVVVVLRAIWLDTTNRWKEAKLPQVVTGLQEVQTMQDSGKFDEKVIKDAATIKGLIGAQPTRFNPTEIESIRKFSDFVSSIDPSNMKLSLENLDTFTRLINIVPNITEILENHNGWDKSAHDNNLIAVVKAIGHIIYNRQPEETPAQQPINTENGTPAEPERNYQEAIQRLEDIFGAYKINLLNKEVEINEAEIIAFGDAHANPMQVIYQMLHTGIGYMRPDKLQELVEIYARVDQATSGFTVVNTYVLKQIQEEGIMRKEEPPVVFTEVEEGCELIDNYFEYTGGSKTFVHLGDVFGDRGACDHFMLALLKKIKAQAEQAGGECIILASNHGTFLEDIGYEKPDADYYDQTRSARVSAQLDPDYIEKLGKFLVENTQLFHFDKRTNTFFTHCPITRQNLEDFVKKANEVIAEVIADNTKYKLDTSQFNLRPLTIPPNDDPEKMTPEEMSRFVEEISQFVKDANIYYKAVMSWFFKDCRNFKDFDRKRGLLPVESLTAVLGTSIRLSNQGKNPAKPFNVTMVHGHDGRGNYNEVRDVYNLNGEGGKLPAYNDYGYWVHKGSKMFKDLYIYTK